MEISSDSSDDEFMEELRKVVPLKRRTKARGRPKKKPIEPKKPAEPTKPMSAYALFFRDTQTAITAENPAAAFAEIAKIVASMWDSLSDEAKDVYKKKTDSAKHSYLQELAEYRASKDEGDTEEDDDKPLSMLKRKTSHDDGENSNVLPPPPKLKLAPSVLLETRKLPKEYSLNAIPPIKLLNSPASGGGSTSANSLPSSSDAGVIPVRHIILPNKVRATSHSPPPAPIQLRNIVPNPASSQHSPITFLQSKPGQVIRLLPAKQAATITSQTNGSNRIIKVTDMIEASENSFSNRTQTSAAADVKESDSEPRKNHESKIDGVQPILQMLAHETYIGDNPEDEDATIISDDSDPDDVISDDDELTSGNNHHHHHNSTMVTMTSILPNDNIPAGGSRLCTREGCPNMAVADSRWNEEYCSAHCVVSHCHDVFDAWIAVRHMTATSVS